MNPTQEWLSRYKKVMVPNYAPFDILPISGEGAELTDIENKTYLDFTGGIAVLGAGHCHPKILQALEEQSKQLWHVSNYFANKPAIELAELLCELTFGEKVFFANSGSEVNEAALKMARRYAFQNHHEEKTKIVSFHKSFHGRSLFTVTAGGTEAYRTGFGPLPPRMHYSTHNDLNELKEVMDHDTCAVIMEPIMGEGGILGMEPAFAKGVRDLCDETGALLIMDEVQTGLGRTGDLFAYQGLGITPDIMTTAKALGNGFPIGALVTTEKIAECFQPGTHGSTFGGNPLATAVGKATLEVLSSPEVLAGVKEKGAYFVAELQKINEKFHYFQEIRGKGLLIGCQLTEEQSGKAGEILKASLNNGLMHLVAGADVIRFAPSLLITKEEIDQAIQILSDTLQEFLQR